MAGEQQGPRRVFEQSLKDSKFHSWSEATMEDIEELQTLLDDCRKSLESAPLD
ncbi:hypothetical protein [Sporosarcina psychrophila]|uniref:Uncharacterized protein n=1 Tax=Sporosarcina psychrophila TaxID=1476 RepID=A0ABV2KEM4_SPOPS